AETYEQDRHRGEERRHAIERGLREARLDRPSLRARTAAAILLMVRGEVQSLTNFPCRLPNGKSGRTAVVEVDGTWALVCRVA
ncbi:MAG TPA: hypothetical protein VF302_07120, partial [Candidatus Limnocylindrales bacterium]